MFAAAALIALMLAPPSLAAARGLPTLIRTGGPSAPGPAAPTGRPLISSEGIAQGVSEALGFPEDSSQTELVTQRLREVNQNYAFVDTVNRGYAVLEATTDELRVEFRGPVSVYEPSSEIRTWASLRVDPERPVVEQV